MATESYLLQECPDVDSLMKMASESAGQSDFGDPARQKPLEAYVAGLRQDSWSGMNDRSRRDAVEYIVYHLGTRLQLIADRKRHPTIAEERVQRPFIIIGPPRSGSTLLHTLLALDTENRAPEHWMCFEPSPPLGIGLPSQERLDRTHKRMMAMFDLVPNIFISHPYMIEEGSGALAECGSDILNMVFTCQELWVFYGSESYRRYLLEADHTAALRFHHEFLQHAQWRVAGKRWALKGSDYLLWLSEAAAQYPDAMFVWTHRDLAEQLGSLASVQSTLRGLTGYPVSSEDRKSIARRAIDHQHDSFQKGMQARKELGESRFFDVSYHDVMANPVGTIERIYERFGLVVSGAHADGIRRWIQDNSQTKHGVHKHSPEQFGMESRAINEQFSQYVDRFGFGFGIRPEPLG